MNKTVSPILFNAWNASLSVVRPTRRRNQHHRSTYQHLHAQHRVLDSHVSRRLLRALADRRHLSRHWFSVRMKTLTTTDGACYLLKLLALSRLRFESLKLSLMDTKLWFGTVL